MPVSIHPFKLEAFSTSTHMALEKPHRTLGKVTTVFATKLKSFTFVPLLKRLPVENRAWKKVLQTSRPNKTSQEPGDTETSMAEEGVYKAEAVYVQDPEEAQLEEMLQNTTQKETYKIKSTYKALAAIPTNTLLLEQQAIDEEVNKKETSFNPADKYSWEDPHAEMCSPAQLRQQTAELYATIDEVLEDSIQQSQVNKANVKSLTAVASRPQTSSPSPKLLGRETRYASSSQPSVTTEKALTKPGVIRPAIATSRFTDDEEFHPNPFKSHQVDKSSRYQYKFVSSANCDETQADGRGASDGQPACGEGLPSEPHGDYKTRLASLFTQTRISRQNVPTSLKPQETHM
ncbi:muscular LMNA-interacting protein isoform X2 [Carassius auratus]|uniref:Muscular LMNA-interacting protein isoform X2 n=1 Tax=Carassius auratus TaxID=7957 RepID=A0A6P6L7M7_CARAU|nr:muscular LMNA-interacting protein isoform X2 [Carassius auratus]